MKKKKCITCNIFRPINKFTLRKETGKRRPECSICRGEQWRHSSAGKAWANRSTTKTLKAKLMRDWRWRLRCQVFEGYGGKCACCNESTYEFLSLDHISGNGNIEREKLDVNAIYRKALRLNFPITYRILCINCNWATGNWGNCPHKALIKH
jgi:hypothetical protein